MSSWAQMVGLTNEQRKIVEPMEKKLNDDLKPIEMELANQRIALCRILGQKDVDSKELDKTLSSIGELNMKQQEYVVHHLVSLKGILTPEQEAKLFTSMMNDICQSCQAAQGIDKDLCGMCGTMKK
jgi:Spy/CpxP family protein refolding chaperone